MSCAVKHGNVRTHGGRGDQETPRYTSDGKPDELGRLPWRSDDLRQTRLQRRKRTMTNNQASEDVSALIRYTPRAVLTEKPKILMEVDLLYCHNLRLPSPRRLVSYRAPVAYNVQRMPLESPLPP